MVKLPTENGTQGCLVWHYSNTNYLFLENRVKQGQTGSNRATRGQTVQNRTKKYETGQLWPNGANQVFPMSIHMIDERLQLYKEKMKQILKIYDIAFRVRRID